MSKHRVYVYVMDILKNINMRPEDFLEYSEDPIKLFNEVKDYVKEFIGNVYSVKVHKIFLDHRMLDGVIEYIVTSSLGSISVKIIYSSNPTKTLMKYYIEEETSKNTKQ